MQVENHAELSGEALSSYGCIEFMIMHHETSRLPEAVRHMLSNGHSPSDLRQIIQKTLDTYSTDPNSLYFISPIGLGLPFLDTHTCAYPLKDGNRLSIVYEGKKFTVSVSTECGYK